MNTPPTVIDVTELSHRYGNRLALDALTLQIGRGEIFAFLGPNGGGKTTLFRVLSTLVRVQQGRVCMLGHELPREARAVRRRIGVVFQAPSLDRKLTVVENIRFQAALYGLRGRLLTERQEELLTQLGLNERRGERTERLSGGLRRRVELAKGMIHRPELLLLDEPSTGLDPGARSDLWEYLERLRTEHQVTVVLTTHLLEEAERADRIAILNCGRLVALDSPETLKASIGGDSITIRCTEAAELREVIAERFQVPVMLVDGQLRLEQPEGPRWIARLMEAFGNRIESITLGRPSLEDVFIDKTGHRFWSETSDDGNGA
jgi:ABC-2 type transport system ATP-binding protein